MRILIGDTETGGLNPKIHSVFSVGALVGDLETGEIIDPTAGQFACEVEYGRGRGRGFPTPGAPQPPSKRAAQVIACARRKLTP